MIQRSSVRKCADGKATALSTLSRISVLWRYSWATFVVTFLVLAFSLPGLLGVSNRLDKALANHYSLVKSGHLWRPFTSWLVHLDFQHLVLDIPYLLIVGLIFEKRHGGRTLLLVFMLATVLASWLCVGFDPHYGSERGSSTGTHALVAFFATWAITRKDERVIVRFIWLGVLGYLVYLSIAGILTGRMGWPFDFFPNCGVDHLGAIGVAMLLAVLLPKRWALPSVKVQTKQDHRAEGEQ